jgi:hypothetical protein
MRVCANWLLRFLLVQAGCGGRIEPGTSTQRAGNGGAQATGGAADSQPTAATDVLDCGPCTTDPPSTAHCITGGRCLVTLATGQWYSYGIAVDDTAVYWTSTDGRISKIPKTGGEPVTLVSGQFSPWALTLDSANLYWVNYARDGNDVSAGYQCAIMQAPIGGGQAMVLATDQPRAYWDIAVDDTSVYWPANPSLDYPSGRVMKVPIGGGELVTLASDQYDPTGIAVDATSVYWSTEYYATMKVAKDGGTPVRLGSAGPSRLATDASNVYVFSGELVVKVPITGGDATTLASNFVNLYPSGIAVDGTSVYWAVPGSGSNGVIGKVAKDGGTPIALISDQENPFAITVDANSVYWINADGGTVMKLTPK